MRRGKRKEKQGGRVERSDHAIRCIPSLGLYHCRNGRHWIRVQGDGGRAMNAHHVRICESSCLQILPSGTSLKQICDTVSLPSQINHCLSQHWVLSQRAQHLEDVVLNVNVTSVLCSEYQWECRGAISMSKVVSCQFEFSFNENYFQFQLQLLE